MVTPTDVVPEAASDNPNALRVNIALTDAAGKVVKLVPLSVQFSPDGAVAALHCVARTVADKEDVTRAVADAVVMAVQDACDAPLRAAVAEVIAGAR